MSFRYPWSQMDLIAFVCFLVKYSEFLQTVTPLQPASCCVLFTASHKF